MLKMKPDGTMSSTKRWIAKNMRKPAKLRLWFVGIFVLPIVIAMSVVVIVNQGISSNIVIIVAMVVTFAGIMYAAMAFAEKFQNKMLNDKVGGTLTADDRADLYLWFAAGQELPDRLKPYRSGYLEYMDTQTNGGTTKQRWLFTGLFSFAFLTNALLLFDDGNIDWLRAVLLVILLFDILVFIPINGGLDTKLRKRLTRTPRRRVAELRESLAKESRAT